MLHRHFQMLAQEPANFLHGRRQVLTRVRAVHDEFGLDIIDVRAAVSDQSVLPIEVVAVTEEWDDGMNAEQGVQELILRVGGGEFHQQSALAVANQDHLAKGGVATVGVELVDLCLEGFPESGCRVEDGIARSTNHQPTIVGWFEFMLFRAHRRPSVKNSGKGSIVSGLLDELVDGVP
jgi:hypothetical protein